MTTLAQLSGEANHPAHLTLELAAIYARAGARVLPLRHKSKAASLNDWPNNASTDQSQITKWFGNGNAQNIGLAMGWWQHTETDHTYLVCVDIDMHGDTNGIQAWQLLVAEHGTQGAPFIADTATGGLHLVYVSPVALTNERGALPNGIDIRGQGGYIMTEPSTHPDNGRKPKWRAGASWPTAKPGLMPQWLLDIIQTKPAPIERTATSEPRLRALGDAPRPGDIYNNTHTWETELAANGWQVVESKSDNHGRKTFYARPGKPATREAHSAVLAHDEGEHGVLTVFSTAAPRELMRHDHLTTTGGHYKFTSPFDFYTCMQHEGDHKHAAQMFGAEVRKQQQPDIDRLMGTALKPQLTVVNADNKTEQQKTDEPPSGHTWVLHQVSELVGVPYEPRIPDRLLMTNGRGLFYSNADNMAAGGSGVMKTWLSALACLQQIQQGKHVVVIDYEMQMHDWFNRFKLLGATDTELELVHYCAPDEALSDTFMGATRITKAQLVMQSEIVRISELQGGLAWVVIDGITNAMTQNNLKLIDNTDTARFWELLPKQIVKLTGAGVGANDHIAKGASENPSPLGAQHKIANTNGAAHILTASSYLSRYPTLNPGVVVLRCIKDRYGEIGQQQNVAQAVFTPLDNGQMRAVVEPYSGELQQMQSTADQKLFDEILILNNAGAQATLNAIQNMVGGNKMNLKDRLLRHASKGKLRNIGTDKSMNWQVVQNDIDTELF
jgi:hypothetical protein